MIALPEIRQWRPEVDPADAEKRVRWLHEQIMEADLAIEGQQRIITAEGPLDTYLLSIESLRASQQAMESTLAELMQQRDIEILNFALAGKRYDQHRANAKTLSLFFSAMQRLFERIGQSMDSRIISSTIPNRVRDLCQMEVAGFYPSSFGVTFATRTCADLTGHSLPSAALEATFDLVNSDNPLEHAARLGQHAMFSYRHLVTTLIKAEATPKVSWRQPDGTDRQWIVDDNDLLVLSNRLAKIHETKPQTIKDVGFLTGASLRRHKFEFDGEAGRVSGKAPEELGNKVTQYFGKLCRITYVEMRFIDETTEQEKRSRTLIDIESVT